MRILIDEKDNIFFEGVHAGLATRLFTRHGRNSVSFYPSCPPKGEANVLRKC